MLTIKNINKYLLLVVGINDFKILRKPKLILLMTQVTESGGRQNIYSIEPQGYFELMGIVANSDFVINF